MRPFAVLIAALCSTPAMADSEWFMVSPATSNPETVQMVDAASIRANGSFLEVWTHLFYHEPIDDMKSYMMQYDVDCEKRMTRKKRYIDYDVDRKLLDSGDYSDRPDEKFKSMAPGTIGELIVTFTCANGADRKNKFLAIDATADYRQVAEFFLERGELVTTKIDEKAR